MPVLEIPYLELVEDILTNGRTKGDRTGTGTMSLFGVQMNFDLREAFPLVTAKKTFWRGVAEELFWFLRGETNVKSLQERSVHIWDEWAREDGELGPVYGFQWRSWPMPDGSHVDQLARVMERIKTNPDCRRLLVSAWNVGDLEQMALMPCHVMFQFYVCDGELSIQVYQRSADVFLGVPFNIASYALLCYMVAHMTGLKPGRLSHVIGDAHLYLNHIEQAKELLTRSPFVSPYLSIQGVHEDICQIGFGDLTLEHYQCHPAIKAPIAV